MKKSIKTTKKTQVEVIPKMDIKVPQAKEKSIDRKIFETMMPILKWDINTLEVGDILPFEKDEIEMFSTIKKLRDAKFKFCVRKDNSIRIESVPIKFPAEQIAFYKYAEQYCNYLHTKTKIGLVEVHQLYSIYEKCSQQKLPTHYWKSATNCDTCTSTVFSALQNLINIFKQQIGE